MDRISYTDKNFKASLRPLFERELYPLKIERGVSKILEAVRKRGDMAVVEYAEKYDNVKLKPSRFKVSGRELSSASKKVSAERKKAIKQAIRNIQSFANKKIPEPWSYSPRAGVVVGERYEPLERVGVYVPGGTAPLVSTVIHTVAVAAAAGVPEIVGTTPPGPDGKLLPELLLAFLEAGATEIYRLGGVYAVGALAYGTETIRPVDKIVGPGNAYVAAAKKQVYGKVALDMVAGPSEIMIIADSECRAEFIAADILSQIEHGTGYEQAVLLYTEKKTGEEVEKELLKQAEKLPSGAEIRKALNKNVYLVRVKDTAQAAEIAGSYAPEHLEIMCRQAGSIAKKVRAAGAIFLGSWTPEPVGDFLAGPSHVLPTGGTAKYFSGLTVNHFFRRMSIINYQKDAIRKEIPDIMQFSNMEGLVAHGRSAEIRGIDK